MTFRAKYANVLTMKFNHNIFELAAERQSLYTGNYLDEISSFSCDNIAHTISCVFSNQILNNRLKLTQEYQDLYAEYFEPEIPWDEFGWWEDD